MHSFCGPYEKDIAMKGDRCLDEEIAFGTEIVVRMSSDSTTRKP